MTLYFSRTCFFCRTTVQLIGVAGVACVARSCCTPASADARRLPRTRRKPSLRSRCANLLPAVRCCRRNCCRSRVRCCFLDLLLLVFSLSAQCGRFCRALWTRLSEELKSRENEQSEAKDEKTADKEKEKEADKSEPLSPFRSKRCVFALALFAPAGFRCLLESALLWRSQRRDFCCVVLRWCCPVHWLLLALNRRRLSEANGRLSWLLLVCHNVLLPLVSCPFLAAVSVCRLACCNLLCFLSDRQLLFLVNLLLLSQRHHSEENGTLAWLSFSFILCSLGFLPCCQLV